MGSSPESRLIQYEERPNQLWSCRRSSALYKSLAPKTLFQTQLPSTSSTQVKHSVCLSAPTPMSPKRQHSQLPMSLRLAINAADLRDKSERWISSPVYDGLNVEWFDGAIDPESLVAFGGTRVWG